MSQSAGSATPGWQPPGSFRPKRTRRLGYPAIRANPHRDRLEQRRNDQRPILTTSPVPRVIRLAWSVMAWWRTTVSSRSGRVPWFPGWDDGGDGGVERETRWQAATYGCDGTPGRWDATPGRRRCAQDLW